MRVAMIQSAGASRASSAELVEDRVHDLLDSFMRRAPCSPARSQLDLDCVHRSLVELAAEHPDRDQVVVRALEALRRECAAENLAFPGADR